MSNYPFVSQGVGKHTLLLVSFLIIIIAWTFATFTHYSNYVAYPMLALWLIQVLSLTKLLSKNERTFIRVSLLYLMIVIFYWLIGYSKTIIGDVLVSTSWILTGVFAIYAMKLFNERELSVIYITILLSAFILIYFFIKMGRTLLAMDEAGEAALVTSAWYGSLFMLLSGLSLILFIHVKKLFVRIVALILLLLTLYLNIIVLQRGTNVIFTMALVGIILVFTLKNKSLVVLLTIIIGLLSVFIYSSGLLVNMFDWIADVVPSERLASRFHEISIALYYEDIKASRGSLSGRSDLIGVSWETFTSGIGHFIFGVGEHFGDNMIIGHHSFFIDTLARYGIIGGAVMFVYFKKQYQIIMSELDKKTDWALYMQCAAVFIFYVLRNFYGQVAYALVNIFILMFFPLTFQIIKYFKFK